MGTENKATKSGNVNDPTVWSLGRIPQAGDDAYANGFTVSLNVSATADTWNTRAGPTAIAGGGFSQTVSGITLTGDVWAGSTNCVTVLNTTGAVLNVVGDCYGSRTTPGVTGAVVQNTIVPTTLNIKGNLHAGYFGSSRALYCYGAGATAVVDGYAIGNDYPGGAASAWTEAVGGTGIIYIRGLICGAYGAQPTNGNNRLFLNTSGTALRLFELRESPNGVAAYLSDVDAPAVGNVRSGVVYYGGTKTGTCAVPAAQYVLPGVPVDNTVGTANVSVDLTPVLDSTAALESGQTQILASIAAIPPVDLSPVITKIDDLGIAVTPFAGYEVTVSVQTASLEAIPGAQITAYTVSGQRYTAAAAGIDGSAVLSLPEGDYLLRGNLAGYSWTDTSISVQAQTSPMSVVVQGNPLSIPLPSAPGYCRVYTFLLKDGVPPEASEVDANSATIMTDPPGSPIDYFNGAVKGSYEVLNDGTPDAIGFLYWDLPYKAVARCGVDQFTPYTTIEVPEQAQLFIKQART